MGCLVMDVKIAEELHCCRQAPNPLPLHPGPQDPHFKVLQVPFKLTFSFAPPAHLKVDVIGNFGKNQIRIQQSATDS